MTGRDLQWCRRTTAWAALVLAFALPLLVCGQDRTNGKLEECIKLTEERSASSEPMDDEFFACAELLESQKNSLAASASIDAGRPVAPPPKPSDLEKQLKECFTEVKHLETALDFAKSNTDQQQIADGAAAHAVLRPPVGQVEGSPIRCEELDYRMAPLFNSATLENFVVGLAALVGLCMLCGFVLGGGGGGTTSIITASAEMRGLTISDVLIRPGSEVIVVSNRTSADVDMTGCSVRVGEHIFHFDDGYNLAKNTKIEVHAGPDARSVKQLPIEDHDKFDSRRCPRLFWTAATVFVGSGETKATLIDPIDKVIHESR